MKSEPTPAPRRAEDLFAVAFNANPHPIIITTLAEGRVVEANDAFLRITGYAREQLIGQLAVDLLWYSAAEREEMMGRLRERGELHDVEIALRKQNGEPLVMDYSAKLVEIGGAVCLLTTASDIAERKRAEHERDELLAREKASRIEAEHINQLYAKLLDREQAARDEAERARREWQMTFDTMGDHVLLVDRQDRLVRANRAFCQTFGLTPEEVVGRPAGELIHAARLGSVPMSACPICNLRRKAERAVIELPAGIISSYPIAVSIDPITDEAGNTIGVVQVARDLTELYRAREEAERERASLNATIEQMADGLMLFDAQAAVIRANRQARVMLELPEGVETGQVIARRPVGSFSNEHGQALLLDDLPVQCALSEQQVVEASLWYTRTDGKRLFLSVAASPLFNEQNQLVGAIALLKDMTEQQREQERSQQADKLRALGQLASGVAHNFNNALAAVLGYTQLSIPKVRGSEVEKYLRVVEQSAKDAARMVERIQNFARARSRTDEFLPIRISDIIHDALDITRPRWRHDAEALGVKYDIQLDWQADEEALVNGEPSELREVFVNIIFNALDAMPEGGRITVRAKADDEHVRLSFTDNGGGMTEETKRRVFEPFFTTKGVSGLGMGLSETYRIVERHGGRIEVESQPRRGAVFTLLLPLAKMPNYQAAGALSASSLRGLNMLVIDDEEHVRNVLAALLVELGHEVTIAASAEEALRLIEEREFNIVFTDLAMPKTDGIATATEIKARRPQIKVVLMSGYGSEGAGERAAASRAVDATLSKPFRVFEIQNALRTLLA
jgi:PAS domain S-box-containing protein